MNKTVTLFSIGGAAAQLGCSRSLLRKLEIEGIVSPPHRLTGSERRAYDAEQMETLRQVIAERRASQQSQHREQVAA